MGCSLVRRHRAVGTVVSRLYRSLGMPKYISSPRFSAFIAFCVRRSQTSLAFAADLTCATSRSPFPGRGTTQTPDLRTYGAFPVDLGAIRTLPEPRRWLQR